MKIPSKVEMVVRLGHDSVTLYGLVTVSSLYDLVVAEMNKDDFLILKGEPDLITFNADKVFGRELSSIPILPGYTGYDGTNER